VKKKWIWMRGMAAILLTLAFVFGVGGCGLWNKYFLELKGAYFYDREGSILKKSPSEITWEENELLLYSPETRKTTPIGYELLELTLPKRTATGEMSDYVIHMAYATHEGRLIFTGVPRMYAPHDYFAFNSPDSVVVSIDGYNAYLVNVKEASAKKLFDGAGPAKTIGVSPDGRYVLYLSNGELFCLDIESGAQYKVMNFDDREFLGWEADRANFLFRDTALYDAGGRKIYSDIRRYALPDLREDVFFSFEEGKHNYEMSGGRYAYTTEKTEKGTVITIHDIYSGETLSVNVGNYSLIWHIELSESREYVAFFGSYINAAGMAIAEIVGVNTETGRMVPEYEQGQGQYFIDSFEWLPGNVLMLNFINTADLYQDLCRLYEIKH